jgi:hypothetical protein
LIAVCFAVKSHYRVVARAVQEVDQDLPGPEASPGVYPHQQGTEPVPQPDATKPVAILFVAGYGGLGRHALLTLMRMFPNHYQGVVFVSVAVADSDVFKGASEIPALEERTRKHLAAYERFAAALGLAATSEYSVGTEVPVEAEKLALALVKRFPRAMVVAGQIIFEEDTLWNRVLHNETAFLIQRRLQRNGVPMIVLPVQLDLRKFRGRLPPGSLRSRGRLAKSSS